MKKISLITFCLIIFILPVNAATLSDALRQTYQNNLELKAERKNLEVQKEVLNISKSDFFPTLTLTGTKSIEDTNKLTNQNGTDASITNTFIPCSANVNAAIPPVAPEPTTIAS